MKDKEQGSEKRSKKSPECFGYPISIFFIVVNEFCERFSYYGMRAVLVLYFRYFFHWDDDLATTIYHTFVALCYLTPILGAVIADSWLGKFKTIVYLSIVYCIGQVILAISAIHDITDTDRDGTPDNMTLHIALSMVGLLLIALGTGGIKPCVAAFGGDQFEDHQDKQRSTFFSIFYLSINAGSLLSTLITPILRAQECGIHTKQQCYPLAFGVPAALMVVSLIVFVVGKSMYVMDAPKGNVLLQVMKCIGFAIKNRFRNRKQSQKKEHWLDWAEEKYDKLLIAQVKMVLKVLFLYIPLPMFWALYDQQGSRWTLQATTMDGNFGAFIIQPDQMQIVNPILIVIMVPIMDNLVYPLIKKCHLNFTPLRKITLGMLLAALAFVAAALLQIQIDDTMPKFPSSSQTQVRFLNLENRDLAVSVAGQEPVTVPSFQASGDYMTFNNESFTVSVAGGNHVLTHFMKGARQTILIDAAGIQDTLEDITSKPEQGANDIKFVNGYHSELNIMIKDSLVSIFPLAVSNYTSLRQGKTSISIESATGQKCHHTMQLGFGSSYTVLIRSDFDFGSGECVNLNEIEDIKQNSIHMAWQVIQYFLLTCGEVIFSVTGLDFSYAQAPSNMKSVLQAGWLLTVAVGNVIVLIVAEAGTLPDQWAEYILFAALLVAVSIIFAIMAYFYTYIDPTEIEAQFLEHEPEDKKEKNELEMKKTDLISSDTKQTKI